MSAGRCINICIDYRLTAHWLESADRAKNERMCTVNPHAARHRRGARLGEAPYAGIVVVQDRLARDDALRGVITNAARHHTLAEAAKNREK